jgi:hypothetical protein
MNIFRRLLGRHEAPPESALPYGLTREEGAAIRVMAASEGWHALQGAAERIAEQYGEKMLATDTTARLHFMRGMIQGVRYIALLPNLIQANADDDTGERRAAERTERDDARRSIALFGTQWGGGHR